MKEFLIQAQDWWSKRETREKQMLQMGAICFLIFVVYISIWSPILNAIDAKRTQIEKQAKTLALMISADQEIKKIEKINGKTSLHSPIAILSALQKEIETAGLQQNASPLKQTSNDMIEVHFQKVEFDKLMSLLIDAVKKEPLTLTQFSAVATQNQGEVNAEVQLKVG